MKFDQRRMLEKAENCDELPVVTFVTTDTFATVKNRDYCQKDLQVEIGQEDVEEG